MDRNGEKDEYHKDGNYKTYNAPLNMGDKKKVDDLRQTVLCVLFNLYPLYHYR